MRIDIASGYKDLLERIARAASRSGRPASAVTLIAVSKTVDATAVRAAFEAGAEDFGENRAQELVAKHSRLSDLPLRWHFIGHLQTNKVRHVLPIATLIHSVDSIRLAERIQEVAPDGATVDVLLQVNTSGEATKFGIDPEGLAGLIAGVRSLPKLRIRGLMTLGPWTDDREAIRNSFRLLREESLKLQESYPEATVLSMGMSGDFEIAIEEGATHVRVGTALFGPRD